MALKLVSPVPKSVLSARRRLERTRAYGRKSLLTPLVAQGIISAVASGASAEVAAQSVGVVARTVRRWKERGENGESPYKAFVQQLAEAQAMRLVQLANVVMKAAAVDARLALEVLSRLDAPTWGRPMVAASVADTGQAQSPMHYDVAKLTEAQQALLMSLLDLMGPPRQTLIEGVMTDDVDDEAAA